ncbi:MAG: hypothetical protein KA149_10385 [Chitinophagales bacterium]|nr:hypothetical protein [Chitinophagales bacterium]
MKRTPQILLAYTVATFLIVYAVSCNLKKSSAVVLDVAAKPFEKLSDYNFFAGVMNELKPNALVVPYDLITPLFTDYAHKARFVYVPEGKHADYDTTQVLQLPVGSCLIKNFYYPEDFRVTGGKRRIMETRLLVHRNDAWEALDYIWNDEQTEAKLESAGDIKEVSWTHYDGTKRKADYIIPNKNQCKGCHWNNGTNIVPIGPKVRNLNRDFEYADGKENQLAHWAKLGILTGLPASDVPALADWADSVHYNTDARARAYLEMNCAHCHNPKGPAYTSGLYLNVDNNNAESVGYCKTPVAAGKATGNLFYDIVPGNPEESIMVFRMKSEDPGIKMPELGKGLVHKEGVDLIYKWIAEMKWNSCGRKE